MIQSRKPSLSASCTYNNSWQSYIQWSFCFSVSIHGTHQEQNLLYSSIAALTFQDTEANFLLCTQSPGNSPLIYMKELIETLFISWYNSCTWPYRMWFVFHITLTTAETHHPPPHYYAFINVQQVLINLNEYNLFYAEEYTPLLWKWGGEVFICIGVEYPCIFS